MREESDCNGRTDFDITNIKSSSWTGEKYE